MELSVFTVFIAFLPILWLAGSLGLLRMPAFIAGPVGLVLAALCSVLVFDFPLRATAAASVEGAVLAFFPILYAIIGAVYVYDVCVTTGYMERIKGMLSGVSDDRRIQVLILAWAFSGFLEGAAGYGTAVAIPVSILVSLGMEPFAAAVTALIGNTAPTAFGAIGIPTITLADLSGYSVSAIGGDVALQLTPFILVLPFLLVRYSGSSRRMRGVWALTLVSGACFAAVNYACAVFVGPELPALLGGIVTLGVILFVLERDGREKPAADSREPVPFRTGLTAWSPYIILFVLIVTSSSLVPPVNSFLKQFTGWFSLSMGQGMKPVEIRLILTPGTLLLTAGIAGGLIQGASLRTLAIVLLETVRKLRTSIITVVSIVALARIMTASGMIPVLSAAVAGLSGRVYPLFAPAVGALGTFLTGSDTSSNVLFAVFQKQTASGIGMDPRWIAAANTSGAALGKMISPQNIAIAAAASGLAGREGDLFRKTLPVCLALTAMLGVLVLLGAFLR